MANNKNAALGQCARKCLAAAFLIGLPMLTASASEDVGSWCEQQWIVQSAEFTDRDNPDYNGLLQRWMQNEGKCKGTVLYEARLALIYSQLDQPAKSKEVLSPVEKQNSKFTYLVRLVDILADTKTLMLTHKMDSTHLEQTDQRFRDYVNRYPDKPEGYAYLAAVEMQLRRYDAAVKLLENVVAKSGRTAQTDGLYRNLTISYVEVGRYQDAYDSAGSAISLRKGNMDDPYFMCALAKADAGLGRFQDAQTALRLIAAKKPEVKQSPEFLSAVSFVIGKIRASDEKHPPESK